MNPIIPLAIDSCTRRSVPAMAMTIRTIAPIRSIQAARLKNSHQMHDHQAEDDSADDRGPSLIGGNHRQAEHHQPLQHDGNHTGPEANRVFEAPFVLGS